jgi:hypothetical protein
MRRSILVLFVLLTACAPIRPPAPPATFNVGCIVSSASTGARVPGARCAVGAFAGETNADGYVLLYNIPAAAAASLEIRAAGYVDQAIPIAVQTHHDEHVALARALRPAPDRETAIRAYQGNFGSIVLPGCGLPRDMLFDPVVLLRTWTFDRPCFERAIAEHARRGDNRVAIDPRADYNGDPPVVDLWHEPARFAEYVADIRAHVNSRGEAFEVLLFTAADGHIGSFIGSDGRASADALAHWDRDVRALAAALGPTVALVTPCWECRHQRDYAHPATIRAMLQTLRAAFPAAWLGMHLSAGSSSVSSWPCDPDRVEGGVRAQDRPAGDPLFCGAWNAEPDDPYRGDEIRFWRDARAEGIVDGLLYQFEVGDPYLNADAYPCYGGPFPGALCRWWEVVARLGADPWSTATAGGDRHGWPQADVLAFEFIYDAYYGRSTEAAGIAWCQRALAIGGWGCGSASYRRP